MGVVTVEEWYSILPWKRSLHPRYGIRYLRLSNLTVEESPSSDCLVLQTLEFYLLWE